tara:strand:- start:10818 stop:11987 length:1170 start_codon:yes stop_codon:yes gene_type:complete
MKIIFSALGFGTGDNFGGSTILSGSNAIELARKGHEVVFLCTNRIDKKNKLFNGYYEKIIEGVRVIYLNTFTIPFWYGDLGPHYVVFPKNIKTLIKNCDIIHCNEFRSFLSIYCTYLANKFNKPVIMNPHGTFSLHNERSNIKTLYNFLFKKIFKLKYSAFFASSIKEKEIYVNSGINTDSIYIIPNAISEFDFNKCDKNFVKKLIKNDNPYILSIGRVAPLKGFGLVVSALKDIPHNYNYIIIGPNQQNYAKDLIKLAEQEGVQNRLFIIGEINDKKDLYSSILGSEIFVHPSLAEAFGMVILEAAITKTPIVINNLCNIAPEFPKDTILTVNSYPKDFSLAINKLLNSKKLGDLMSENTFEFVKKNYYYSQVINKLELTYKSIINAR